MKNYIKAAIRDAVIEIINEERKKSFTEEDIFAIIDSYIEEQEVIQQEINMMTGWLNINQPMES